MKHIKKSIIGLIGLFLLGLAGCKPDFMDYEVPSGTTFLFPDSISLLIDNDGLATINGMDTCFVQLVDGEDVVEMNTLYVVGDNYFYGGITSYLQIHPVAVGEAQCRLFNNRLGFDTTIKISVSESAIPNDTILSEYMFYPEETSFLVTHECVKFGVIGPKQMGAKIMDKFILSSSSSGHQHVNIDHNGHIIQNANDSYLSICFNYVGTAYVKFYNEDFDTLVRVDVLPVYNTFEEPNLDFDDNRDSVIFKLGNPQIENPLENNIIYNCQGETYPYTLQVNFTPSDVIKDYEVAFADEEARVELRAFVEERYMQRGTWNGYYIYARAYDITYPNPYDSESKVLIENFGQGKVIYKNHYPNW